MKNNPFVLTEYTPGVYLLPYQVCSIQVDRRLMDCNEETWGIEIRVETKTGVDTLYVPAVYNTKDAAVAEVTRMVKLHESIMSPLLGQYESVLNKLGSSLGFRMPSFN